MTNSRFFILDGSTAFEVKETPSAHDLKILKNRAGNIGLKKHALIGKNIPDSGFHNYIWGGAIY